MVFMNLRTRLYWSSWHGLAHDTITYCGQMKVAAHTYLVELAGAKNRTMFQHVKQPI
jgi:3-mercaptopyruvate sulfurtransferase SseA